MHGEYKVSGGKLVVVDLDVEDGRLHNVQLSGDFFLEPDTALAQINAALEGLPATASADDIARAVDAALDADVAMYGFSPDAVAATVLRALGRGPDGMSRTSWNDHDWQLIHEPPQSPAMHMALDEVITDQVSAGHRAPTLRVWEWSSSCVVIGRFQSLANEVDAERRAAPRYRGGAPDQRRRRHVHRAGQHDHLFDQCPAVDGPGAVASRNPTRMMDAWVIEALGALGIKAWYQPLNDIASEAGKIAGAAQARRGKAVLHHVTMAYDIDAAKMLEVLRIGREKLSDKGTASAAKRVDPLRSQTGMAAKQ